MTSTNILTVKNVSVQYAALNALNDISFSIKRGQILGLIGPNGSGKTTLLNSICGFATLKTGSIYFVNTDISNIPAYSRTQMGLGRSFQIGQLFESMTVLDNVLTAAFCHYNRRNEAQAWAFTCLERVGLMERSKDTAQNLNLASRKRLELAKALAVKPRLLLLDEVMAGLNPAALAEMMELILSLTLDGTAIILIEHIMQAIVALADQVIVLAQGKVIAEGTPDYITQHSKVLEAYLGEAIHD